ncbi:MAG: CbiX/SirB N-terminal domain-containing protein [Pseudomonadota bacterium]
MAPAPEREIILISHGSPFLPVLQEIAGRDVAHRLAELLPGAQVRGVTLAAKGALEKAVEGLDTPVVCPWFMSDGWFVGTHLPKRLRAAGLTSWRATPPLGLMPGIGALLHGGLRSGLAAEGWRAADTTLIMAAHGSPSSDRPRIATEAAAKALSRRETFKAIRTCYVDEPPAIRDAARVDGQAMVLPFFAARAGHVTDDLPEELEAAGFEGPVLAPVGTWQESCALAAEQILAVPATQAA